VSVPAERLPLLRQRLGPPPAPVFPPSFLKHADEQTVAGLAAVYQAVHDYHLELADLASWGVMAAPQLLGRNAMGAILERFAAEGAWGISPHLIPHRTLHSVAGTICQALGLRGPNFGVGGGPGAAAEAMLVASALLADRQLPGLWVILSGSLPAADQATESPKAIAWEAVAMALTLNEDRSGARNTPLLQVGTGLPPRAGDSSLPDWPPFTAAALVAALARTDAGVTSCWRLPYAGWALLHCPGGSSEGRA